MNQDILAGHWKELKGKVLQQWGELTDDDLKQMQGTYEELSGALQRRYGYEKDRAKKEIDDFLDSNNYH